MDVQSLCPERLKCCRAMVHFSPQSGFRGRLRGELSLRSPGVGPSRYINSLGPGCASVFIVRKASRVNPVYPPPKRRRCLPPSIDIEILPPGHFVAAPTDCSPLLPLILALTHVCYSFTTDSHALRLPLSARKEPVDGERYIDRYGISSSLETIA